jgi:O-methyltransferase involved in polyketide biosynthesis
MNEVNLGSVQETLFLPLWGRAVETQKPKPILVDRQAVSIINNVPYDFTKFAKNIGRISRLSWIARSLFFDNKIRAFLESHPEATIVNIGCGLDTTFDRVDNGKIRWIDLDMPDTIELRKKYLSETDRNQFIPKSVFDKSWYDAIENKNNVMLLIAGVLYYFDEMQVMELFTDFHDLLPGVEVIFDFSSLTGVRMANKKVLEKGGMNKSACLKWGIDDIRALEEWNSNIEVICTMPMFKEFKKNYPAFKRIGMIISDRMKIMSLAHIRIN